MKTFLLICLSFFHFFPESYSQWQVFNENNTRGLQANLVSDMIKTEDGNIWFATEQGVVRYSKSTSNWINYSLPNNMITDLYFDGVKVWVGTNGGGVSYFYNNLWTSYNEDNGLAGNVVKGIVKDNFGKMWFATYGGGICSLNGNIWTTYNVANIFSTKFFYCAFKDHSGNLWFGSYNHGVMKFDGLNWINFSTTNGLVGLTVLKIFEDTNNRIWFCCSNGVSVLQNGVFTNYTVNEGLAGNIVYCAYQGNDNKVRLGTNKGVSIFGETIINIDTSSGLSNMSVTSIIQDNDGSYYYGHENGGASCFNGNTWYDYSNWTGLGSNVIYAGCESADGSFWFTTYNGVIKYDGIKWSNYSINNSNPTYYYSDIAADQSGNVFVAINTGLYKNDGANWTKINLPNNYTVYKVFIDKQNNVWVAKDNYRLAKYSNGIWSDFSSTIIGNHSVYEIFEDVSGKMWFGTEYGIFCKDGNTWTNYNNNLIVRSINQDKAGNIWFGVNDYDKGGLYKINENLSTQYMNGSHTKNINSIYCDSDGKIWVGGYGYLNSVLLTQFNGTKWNYYNNFDNLYNVNNIFEDSHHNLWICSNNGIARGDLNIVDVKELIDFNETPLQNFPNPFSAETTIQFELNSNGDVDFSIYDLYGKLIQNQLFKNQPKGIFKYKYQAGELPSGIYFYKLTAGSQNMQNKMIITK